MIIAFLISKKKKNPLIVHDFDVSGLVAVDDMPSDWIINRDKRQKTCSRYGYINR